MTFIDYLTDMNVMPGEDEFMKKIQLKVFSKYSRCNNNVWYVGFDKRSIKW